MPLITIADISYHASMPMRLVVKDEAGGLWWRETLDLRPIAGGELERIDPRAYPQVLAASFDRVVRQDGESYHDYRVKPYVGRFYGLGTTVAVQEADA